MSTMQGSGQSTEWDDALRKFGIAPGGDEKERAIKEESIIQMVEDTVKEKTSLESTLENATLDELDELEDEEDERVLLQYRQKRLLEMQESAIKSRFGEVLEITAQDYVHEVNEAGKDVWVVLHLYERGVPVCTLVNQHLVNLARKFPKAKFIKAIASLCIKDFPAAHLPAIFVYYEGKIQKQFMGSRDLGGPRIKEQDLELLLASTGAIETDLQSQPKKELNNVLFSSLNAASSPRW